MRGYRSAGRMSGFSLILLLMAPAIHAEWPSDPMTNVPIITGSGDQALPVIVPDAAGGAIVQWHNVVSGTDYDIYVQRVDDSATRLWTPAGVPVVVTTGIQAGLSMIPDGASGMFVAWQDERSGNSDIYVQHVDAAGTRLWTANGVAVCTAAGHQYSPYMVSDGAGGLIVAWYDGRGANYDIYARRVNSAGVPQWTANGNALCTTTFDQYLNSMIPDGSGGAILAWEHRGANSDIYVHRVNGSGVVQWTANGVALCTAAGEQIAPYMVTDGLNGAIVVWMDNRAGTGHDIYARRVNSAGAPQWAANGIPVCTAANEQFGLRIVTDAAGGAIATWYDNRIFSDHNIYASRITHGGLTPWTANGVALCAAVGGQGSPALTADGQGGAIAAWTDSRAGATADIYAQRVDASGVVQLAVDGVAVCNALGYQDYPVIVVEGDKAIVAWQDDRNGNQDIYAQRVDLEGFLADPAPVIVSVADVPRDQGGKVRIAWSSSFLDVAPFYQIESYVIWRQIDLEAGAQALNPLAAPWSGGSDVFDHQGRVIRIEPSSTGDIFWEFVERIPALGYPGYSFLAPTATDSMPSGNPLTVFQVDALPDTGSTFWSSDPDSGYSVDNLAPGAPSGFLASYQGANTFISWNENGESDLYGYRLHRGTTSGFMPGPGNLIAAPPSAGYNDPAGTPYWYKLAAIDVHGNIGPFVTTEATSPGSVPGPGAAVLLSHAAPNPSRGSTSLQLETSTAGPVEIEIFDARGRLVRKTRSEIGAGPQVLEWDGLGSTGEPVANGRYYFRVTAGGVEFHRSVVILR